jgi:hypothetical protein
MSDFSNICIILGTLYENYRDDINFRDFIEFNDLGLPLAYFTKEGLAQTSEDGNKYILETWELFVSSLGLKDTGFTTLEEMFELAEKGSK